MARYKKIVKKKEKKTSLFDTTETAKSWLHDNLSVVALGVGGAILVLSIAYGVIYYRQISAMDAYARLYQAGSDTKSTIVGLREVIERGGPDKVMLQARFDLAGQLFETGEFPKAAEEYGTALKMAEKGTLIYELAMFGEAKSLARAGKQGQAEAKLRELAEVAVNYPKGDVLMNLVFLQASAGKKEEAAKTLERIKSEHPSYQPETFLDETMRSVNEGKLAGSYAEGAANKAKPALKVHEKSGSGGK